MCGILGIINNNFKKEGIEKLLRKLFVESETRGKEASGFCFANDKFINVGKTSQTASFLVKNEEFKNSFNLINAQNSEFKLFFGHARLVTNGYEQFVKNNQPVCTNNMVLVHNGIVINYKELWNRYLPDISPETELDTEVIPLLYHKFLATYKNPQIAVNKIFDEAVGVINIALYDIERSQFLLASNNGSLFCLKNSDFIVFASEKRIIRNALSHLNNSNKFTIDFDVVQLSKEKIIVFDLPVKEQLTIPKINIIDIDSKLSKKYINTSLEHSNNVKLPDRFIKHLETINEKVSLLKRCTRCLLPETFPGLHFDNKGVCNVCNSYFQRELLGKDALMKVFSKLPPEKQVLVAFSGGRDSSYCLHYIKKELEINCIAYSYDWGMLTDLGRRNQSLMCSKLGIEHILVSADIRKKRKNIRLNVEAWLRKPSLGMIPLFMAGDKQYFSHAYKVLKEVDAPILVMGENFLEKTGFKTAFSGARQTDSGFMAYHISFANKLRMIAYYLHQYITNPSYINKSLIDTFSAASSYYKLPHNYLNLFNYIPWIEENIDNVLINEYGWETDPEINSTWRIGDGTAAFYNYIYYVIAGFSEADTFRSNQIREGLISREKAFSLLMPQNQPRWLSIKWYCDTVGIDFEKTISIINNIPKLYKIIK